jgi:hypothetical protein
VLYGGDLLLNQNFLVCRLEKELSRLLVPVLANNNWL